MTAVRLQAGELEGRFSVHGVLTLDTVADLWASANGQLESPPALTIDLSGVERVDSAGLALLIEWTRRAAERSQRIRFVGLPQQLLDIARVSGLDAALPLYRDSDEVTG